MPIAQGTLITRYNVSGQAQRWGAHRIPVTDGQFVLQGLDPDGTFRVVASDAEQQWGASFDVSPKATGDAPVTIRLAPCGSARIRLVDPIGKPVAGYRAALQIVLTAGGFQWDMEGTDPGKGPIADAGPAPGYSNHVGGPPTDQAGQATFTGLIPGATYRLVTTENDRITMDSELLRDFQVGPGQTLELPQLTIKASRAEN